MRLSDLLDHTGLDVLDHLDREVTVPVVDGLQAQGDLLVVPLAELPQVSAQPFFGWWPVPPDGVELVRGVAGGHAHTLVADPGVCRWTPHVRDPFGLAVALVDNRAPVHLVHAEHGGTGVAPGCWVVRRQRERGRSEVWSSVGGVLVAD